MAGTSVRINDTIQKALKDKHTNISSVINELLKIYVQNGFSTVFEGNGTVDTDLKRKNNFLKITSRKFDALFIEIKETHYNTPSKFEVWLEIMARHGITQTDYVELKELIHE